MTDLKPGDIVIYYNWCRKAATRQARLMRALVKRIGKARVTIELADGTGRLRYVAPEHLQLAKEQSNGKA